MADKFQLDLTHRPRRLRRTASLRAMVEETVLRPADFIAPLFVVEGRAAPDEIKSMPGVFRLGIDDLVRECKALHKLKVPAVALFPKLDPKLKDEEGSEALNEDALVPQSLRAWEKAQAGHRPVPVPERAGEPSVFKHVVYVIKENRTYDQVFGDIGKGNSDPKLVMYGREVTPNHHALAEHYVLLDNFYTGGAISFDGVAHRAHAALFGLVLGWIGQRRDENAATFEQRPGPLPRFSVD